jgi:arginase family enzyme
LSYEQAMRALHVLLADPALAGLTITELNPDHTEDASTVKLFTKGIVDGLAQAPAIRRGAS